MIRKMLLLAAAGFVSLGLVTASHAGSENEVYIEQRSSSDALSGNSLQIDQSGATNSLVIGPNSSLVDAVQNWTPNGGQLLENSPNLLLSVEAGSNASLLSSNRGLAASRALQDGGNNSASITLEGTGGEVQLRQINTGSALNTANITSNGASLGGVLQQGSGNAATLSLNSGTGLISQSGTDLTAELRVGSGGNGQIVQSGTGLDTGVVVVEGGSVTYTQIGNNAAPAGTPLTVSTNPGSNISITQTNF